MTLKVILTKIVSFVFCKHICLEGFRSLWFNASYQFSQGLISFWNKFTVYHYFVENETSLKGMNTLYCKHLQKYFDALTAYC